MLFGADSSTKAEILYTVEYSHNLMGLIDGSSSTSSAAMSGRDRPLTLAT
jgi:hypothetical protein